MGLKDNTVTFKRKLMWLSAGAVFLPLLLSGLIQGSLVWQQLEKGVENHLRSGLAIFSLL